MVPVESDAVSHVGYDEPSRTLHVTWKNGRTYQHPGVPPEKFDALMAAPSKGRFLNTEIKPEHPHRS